MYTNACHQSGIPKLIHSDNNPTYFSNSIKRFFKAHEIKFSKTGSDKNANQVSESVNSRLKANLLLSIHNEDRKSYKNFRLGWNDKFKNVRAKKRV